MVRRFVLRRRTWWPPSKRVLYVLKTVTVVVSATASVLMMIPAAAWQRQVSAVMGMEGPDTLGYTRTLIIAAAGGWCVRGGARVLLDLIKTLARFFIRRWHLHDEMALFIGTAIVVVLAITLVNGVLYPWLPGRREPRVPTAEHHHQGRHRATATARKIR